MELERKYNKGAKIVLFISVMAIPMQLLTSALISRVSPEASGTLGVLEIFYNAIISFFMLGGETGIVKLLTNQKGITSKKNFIIKYIFLCVIFFVIMTTILRLFNIDIIKVITGREAQTSILMYAVAIFIIINNILLSYIKESEKFIHYAIGIKLFNLGNLLAVLVAYFIIKDANIEIILLLSMGVLQLLNIIYITAKEKIFYKLKKDGFEKLNIQIFKYIFFLHLSTILTFVYDKVDQIIVINKLGISILGGYYLIVKVVNMVKLIPNTYNSTFYPYICKQLNKQNSNNIFNTILSKNLLFIFPMTIVITLNSNLIITVLFGTEYLQYSLILQILTSVVLFSAPTPILNNYLYAIGLSKKYFFISLISIIVQIVIIYFSIDIVGIIGVSIARGISTILILIFCKLSLKKQDYLIKISKEYYIYCAIEVLFLVITNILNLGNILGLIVTIIILALFLIKNRMYVKNILKGVKNHEFF